MNDVELAQIKALARCRFSPGSTAKAFVRKLSEIIEAFEAPAYELSEKQTAFLDNLAHQYRGQIGHCMSVACVACKLPASAERDEILVALDTLMEERADDAAHVTTARVASWAKLSLARYNSQFGKTFAHAYEYATKVAPSNRRANTRGDIFCRFCGEQLFSGVKQPHKLVRESADTQRHLTICALQVLAGVRDASPPGHRSAPMDSLFAAASFDELLGRSSIGAGLRNIEENGLEAELADLEREMRGTR